MKHWISPRKPNSGWSRVNKELITKLQDEKRMLPSGEHAIERAKANGSWHLLDDIENLLIPEKLALALLRSKVSDKFDKLPRSKKRNYLERFSRAKREQTQNRYIQEIIAELKLQ
jgi:uncharacterized protein YdeI (YjbR/CyaY-like superfamily)